MCRLQSYALTSVGSEQRGGMRRGGVRRGCRLEIEKAGHQGQEGLFLLPERRVGLPMSVESCGPAGVHRHASRGAAGGGWCEVPQEAAELVLID